MNIELTEDHVYYVDGERKPGVTEVLSYARFIDYSMIPAHIIQPALTRGSFVHLAIALLNSGELDEESRGA